MLLKKIESIINRSPFYNLIRFNILTDWIIEMKEHKTERNVNFYSSFLGADSSNKLIFDIGANKGNMIKAFLKLGYNVIALEPEKKALSTLYWRYKNCEKVQIIEKGVSDEVGKLSMHVTDARSGLNTLSDKWVESLGNSNENRWHKALKYREEYTVDVTTLEHLMDENGVPYFIKIDVEGFELNVIKGIKRLPSFLSFEANLPEFTEDTVQIIKFLHNINDKTEYNYSFHSKMESPNWISKSEILELICNKSIRYIEIICKF